MWQRVIRPQRAAALLQRACAGGAAAATAPAAGTAAACARGLVGFSPAAAEAGPSSAAAAVAAAAKGAWWWAGPPAAAAAAGGPPAGCWRAGLACGGGATAAARGFATHTQRKAAANPGLKYWKPTSPGQRGRVTVRRTGIWRGGPIRSLARGAAKSGGRNHSGRISVWHRGGGARKVVRSVDFRRRPIEGPAVVERLEYDPGRTAYLALLRHDRVERQQNELRALEARAAALRAASAAGGAGGGGGASAETAPDAGSGPDGGGGGGQAVDPEYAEAVGELLAALKRVKRENAASPPRTFSYIVAPQDLQPGDTVASGDGAAIRPGNMMRLRDIPVGMPMHNLELRPGQGAALCRSAGCVASIVNKQETHAIVRLPSGEQRLFSMECRATIGAVSNPQHQNRVIGKAGYARHMGRRPIVRGVAMNPVDHPHGGGTAGGRPSVTPWGIPCKGYRTRRKSPMAKWVLVPRKRGKGSQGGGDGGGGGGR